MKVETFCYDEKQGFTLKDFPELDSENSLLLVFADPKFAKDPKPLQQLADYYNKSYILGCSTAGEILQNDVRDNSLSIAIIKFEKTSLKEANAKITDICDSKECGKQLAEQLNAPSLKHILILSDGLHVNGTDLIEGILANVNKNVTVSGGLAGDGSRFKETWTFSRALGVSQNSILAVGLYGDNIEIHCTSQGGWDTFGPERKITSSHKNILYEIDGQPALPLYKKYLGNKAQELPSSALLFPMAIRSSLQDPEKIVRTILAVDEAKQALIFAGDMPTGWFAQLMTANFERLIEGAGLASSQLIFADPKTEILNIAISCVGRRLVLGEKTEEELDAVLAELPKQTKQIGFYSYGEISPTSFKNCDLHNQTMTLTSIVEKP